MANEEILDEMIDLIRKKILDYSELVEHGEIDEIKSAKALEIIGKAGARLGRLVEIRNKIASAEDTLDKYYLEASRIIDELDHSMISLQGANNGNC
jgi:hypothetical protein